jgi:surface antigen
LGSDRGFDRDSRWRARYGRTYSYGDDSYYQECRDSSDPAGVLAGALIGGLLGNAAASGGARGPATVAGVIVGGAVGGALTSHMECADRSYAYKSYYDGFNSGHAHSDWRWNNPDNGHSGEFEVGDYYTDPDGFRCATVSQRVYMQDEPQVATGRACQQPDGSWAVVQ